MGEWGGHNSSRGGAQYAAELRILLVYLSESLGRLGQNGGGHWEGHIFHLEGGPPAPVEPPLAEILFFCNTAFRPVDELDELMDAE